MRRAFVLFALLVAGCGWHRPASEWKGLWRVGFELSEFCPAPATECTYVPKGKRTKPRIWLKFDDDYSAASRDMPAGLYLVTFIGRRSLFDGHYGHLGMSDAEVVVDHLVSIRKVEEPPEK